MGEAAQAFVPEPLPPNPSLDWMPDLRCKFDQALLALGRFDSISTFLPDISLFLYMYVRKEAVLSSMIEGTQASLSDLLLFELDMEPGVPLDDVREAASTLRVHRALLERPITASGGLVKKTGITPATVNKCLRHLERLGIVRELTSRRRNRVFSYTGILEIMNQGTEIPG